MSKNETRQSTITNRSNGIATTLSKEQFKSVFHLLTGKLDTTTKIFKKKLVLNEEDLIELNNFVQEKLNNHKIPASTVTVNIMYEKNKMSEFGVWKEFIENNWKIPEVITDVRLNWDFLIELPNYENPQRHTLTVKISSETNFSSILPILLSGDLDEIDEAELKRSPVVAQANFINHLLSDELLNIIEKWVESRREAECITSLTKWLRSSRRFIYELIHCSIPLFLTLGAISILSDYGQKIGNTVTTENLIYTMNWLLISLVVIWFSEKISRIIGHASVHALSEYGDYLVFDITNGDKNKQSEIRKKNKNNFIKFIFSTLLAIIINIASGVVSYLFFK